jgi:hypothetical protein
MSPGWYEASGGSPSVGCLHVWAEEELVEPMASVEVGSVGRRQTGDPFGDDRRLVLVQEVPIADFLSGTCLADLEQRVQQNGWGWSATGAPPTQKAP